MIKNKKKESKEQVMESQMEGQMEKTLRSKLRLKNQRVRKVLILFSIFLIFAILMEDNLSWGLNNFEERGASFYEQGKYEIAQELLERAFGENALSQRVYFYLGNIYYIKKEYEKAIRFYQKGLEISKGERQRVIEYNLGRAYQKWGDYELARIRYENLVGVEGYEEVYFNLGLMSYEEKDLEGVKKWWGEYVGGSVVGGLKEERIEEGKISPQGVGGGIKEIKEMREKGTSGAKSEDESKDKKEKKRVWFKGFEAKKKRIKKVLELIDQKIIIKGRYFLKEMGDEEQSRKEEIIIDLEREERELIEELESGGGLEDSKEEVDIDGKGDEIKFKEVEKVILEEGASVGQ